jgi:hypothetical protein
MVNPGQFGPPPAKPGGSGRLVLMIVLGVVGMLCLCCGVGCTGIFVFWSSSPRLAREVKTAIEEKFSSQPAWVNDFVAQGQLSPAYTAALDAVSGNEQVMKRLGDPVEAANETEELFRRKGKGQVKPGEVIEFDVQGPNGTGVVSVVTGQPGYVQSSPFGIAGAGISAITVKFSDGSEIDVPPPKQAPDQP